MKSVKPHVRRARDCGAPETKNSAIKEVSQGLVKVSGELYVGKDGKTRAKFITIGEAFSGGGDGARCHVRLKLLPFPQPSPKGNCCWLHVFPDGEQTEHEPKEKFKLSDIVLSDGMPLGAEFTSPSGCRTIKLEANPADRILKIYDIKPKEEELNHETKSKRKDS